MVKKVKNKNKKVKRNLIEYLELVWQSDRYGGLNDFKSKLKIIWS